MIGTDYMGSCKSKYHAIMTTADPIMKIKTFPIYVLTKRNIDNRFCDHIVIIIKLNTKATVCLFDFQSCRSRLGSIFWDKVGQ